MRKVKFKWSYIVYIAALAAAIFLTSVITDNIKLKNYLKNDMHYEAWDLVYHNPVSFVLSSSTKDDRIKFFDVMATHQSDDSNNISGDWSLPDFTGWSCAEVACALKNIGQPYEVRFMEAPQMQHNVVVKQEPAFGESIGEDDTVVLYANSAYGKDIAVYNNIFTRGQTTECGEWIIFIENKSVFKSHSDFSDVCQIYECKNDFPKHSVFLAAHEDKVYLSDNIHEDSGDTFYLYSVSLSDGSTELLYEHNNQLSISHYYDNRIYFLWGSYYDILSREYVFLDKSEFSVIYNDIIYTFIVDNTDKEKAISYLYTEDYFDQGDRELQAEIEGRIIYIVPYENYIAVGYQSNDNEEIVDLYDLENNKITNLTGGTYSRALGGISIKSMFFNKELYVLSRYNYDFKFALKSLSKMPIKVYTADTVYTNMGGTESVYGNYLFPDSIYSKEYLYNLLTGEYEKIDAFESPEKEED